MMRAIQTLVVAAALLSMVSTEMYVRVRAQVVTPRPEELRFQALLNEPVATADRRAVVAGTSALLVKDRQTGQCFIAISIGNSMGLSPASCPQ